MEKEAHSNTFAKNSGRQLDIKLVCWFTGFMKTTFDLPDDLVQELKLRSVHERRKLKDVAAQAIRRGLQLKEPDLTDPPPLPEGLLLNEHGFPVYRCRPDAPATRMTARELIALEQEIIEEEEVKRVGLTP